MKKTVSGVVTNYKNDAGDMIQDKVDVTFIEFGFDTDVQEEFADINVKFGHGWTETVTVFSIDGNISGMLNCRIDMMDNKQFMAAVCDVTGYKFKQRS